MALYALIHGAGDSGGYWNWVKPLLEAAGHDVVAPDMPIDRDDATLTDCAIAVIDAIGDRDDVIVVAQSFGGFVAPIVADRVPTRLMVYVAAMIPLPGETAYQWFKLIESEDSSEEWNEDAVFFHDVPADVVVKAKSHGRSQKERMMNEPLPLTAMPTVPTRAVVGSLDRVFPAKSMRRIVRDRLGILPHEIESGHCIALAQPQALVAWLEEQRAALER